MNRDKRTPLRKAVDWLIYEGKIEQDKDLQEIFELSASTISAYITGKPGKDFVRRFEKYFELNLKDFEQHEVNLEDLAKYIIETHAMLRVLTAKLIQENDLKDAERVVNRLLKEEQSGKT